VNEHSFILNHSPQDGKKIRWIGESDEVLRRSRRPKRARTLLINVSREEARGSIKYAEMRHPQQFSAVVQTVVGF